MELTFNGILILLLAFNPAVLSLSYNFYGAFLASTLLLVGLGFVFALAGLLLANAVPSIIVWLSGAKVDRRSHVRGALCVGILCLDLASHAFEGLKRTWPSFDFRYRAGAPRSLVYEAMRSIGVPEAIGFGAQAAVAVFKRLAARSTLPPLCCIWIFKYLWYSAGTHLAGWLCVGTLCMVLTATHFPGRLCHLMSK
jgi:hypothetical protein